MFSILHNLLFRILFSKTAWLFWLCSFFYLLLFKWLSTSISFENNIQASWSLIQALQQSAPKDYIHHFLINNTPPLQTIIYLVLTPLSQWLRLETLSPEIYFFLKSPSLWFHLCWMLILFKFRKEIFITSIPEEKSPPSRIIAFITFFFWPASLYLSACFFSYDSLAYLFLFLSLLAYKKRNWQRSGIYFALACSSCVQVFYTFPVIWMLHSLEDSENSDNQISLKPSHSLKFFSHFRELQKNPAAVFILSSLSFWIILNSFFFLYDPILFLQNIAKNFSVFQYTNLNAFNFYNLFSANYISLTSVPQISFLSYALLLAGVAILWHSLNLIQKQSDFFRAKNHHESFFLKILGAFFFLWLIFYFAPGTSERSYVLLFPFLIFLVPYSKYFLLLHLILGILLAINQDMILESYFGNKRALNGVIPIFSSLLQVVGLGFCVFKILIFKTKILNPTSDESIIPPQKKPHQKFLNLDTPLSSLILTHVLWLRKTFKNSYDSSRDNKKLSQKHLILLSLVWLFVFFSLQIQLGTKTPPKTSEYLNQKWKIILNTEKDSHRTFAVKDLWMFIQNETGSLQIECPSSKEVIEHTTTGDSFYMWRKLSFNNPCESNVIFLSPSPKDFSKIQISEIHLRLQDKSEITATQICMDSSSTCVDPKTHPWFDEALTSELDLSYYGGSYFDEIYYVRSIIDLFQARYPYESTHPHLAKFITTAFVKYTAMAPYYWRLPNVFFGSLIPILLFAIAFILFRSRTIAWSSLTLSACDPARIALSRIFTIDIPVCFWILLGVFFLIKFIQSLQNLWLTSKPLTIPNFFSKVSFLNLLLCSFSLGCAVGTKWIGLFTLVISIFTLLLCVLIYLVQFPTMLKSKLAYLQILLAVSILVLIPPFLYWLSFSPLHWTMGNTFTWDQFFEWNKNMWDYHRNLKATHPYSSRFYTWPFMQVPMAFYIHIPYEASLKQNIFVIGNPILWWLSLPACFYILFKPTLWSRSLVLIPLLFFGGHFLSWILSSRITFIYHYLVSSCFACVLLSYCFQDISSQYLKYKKLSYAAWIFLIFAAGLIFFPSATGIVMPAEYFRLFNAWFDGWYF